MTSELRFLLARLVTGFFAALAVAVLIPDGVAFPPQGTREFWLTITLFAAVLAVVNAYVRPVLDVVLKPVTCVLGALTLGLSHVLISAGVFWLTAATVESIHIQTGCPLRVCNCWSREHDWFSFTRGPQGLSYHPRTVWPSP